MKNIFWPSSTCSGLCDRMIDIALMSTSAKLLNANLFFNWCRLESTGWERSGNETKYWHERRYSDYRYENFIQYFNTPDNFKVNSQLPIDYNIFSDYLGGVFSAYKFHSHFYKSLSLDNFLTVFYETMSKFTPTKKLLDLTSHLPAPDIGLHLRREDKIRVHTDEGSITAEQLISLDKNTKDVVKELLKTNSSLYIATDCQHAKKEYEKEFNIIKDEKQYSLCEQTYVDLYMLSRSKYIVMSSKHSNFALFASLINKSKLVYFYNKNCVLYDSWGDRYDNVIYFKNILNHGAGGN